VVDKPQPDKEYEI